MKRARSWEFGINTRDPFYFYHNVRSALRPSAILSALPVERVGAMEPVLGYVRTAGRRPEVPREAHCEGGGARRQGVPGGEQGGVDLPPLENIQEDAESQTQEDTEDYAQKRHLLLPR